MSLLKKFFESKPYVAIAFADIMMIGVAVIAYYAIYGSLKSSFEMAAMVASALLCGSIWLSFSAAKIILKQKMMKNQSEKLDFNSKN